MYTKNNQLDNMMAWEEGSLSEAGEIQLFSELLSTGLAWQLQGCYGRTAMGFINNGILSKQGKIMINLSDIYE